MSTLLMKASAASATKDHPATVSAAPPAPKGRAHEAGASPNAEKKPPAGASSPKRGGADDKKKRRGRAKSDVKRKEKSTPEKERRKDGKSSDDETEIAKSNFDCSGAIAQVCDGLWVSAVSGTRMGASLEATLLECGVTAVLSTIVETAATPSETFQLHAVDAASEDTLASLHDACDFINETVQDGGVVFIHSRSGFSRSDWAVLIVLGYMIKYQGVKLQEAMDSLTETTKHKIAPAGKFRRDVAQFEEAALGEASVDAEWLEAENGNTDSKSHSLSRQKLAENLNDRRLLKKKSPHK
ncbi:hypothetical protein M885DRAFT_516490 [Pelagophyceae sp. CCMP2097]|nr:hypothetical protein M885DRAFT_516490 [Pelagophyceae sp. CCMP2097]